MGIYINKEMLRIDSHINKAEILENDFGAELWKDRDFNAVDPDKAVICVVENPMFDAAGVVVTEQDFKDFSDCRYDPRPRTWLLMDKETVFQLNPQARKAYGYAEH